MDRCNKQDVDAPACNNAADSDSPSSSNRQISNGNGSGASDGATTSSGSRSGLGNNVAGDKNREDICAICLQNKCSPLFMRCGHSFCESCIVQLTSFCEYQWSKRCPICRKKLKVIRNPWNISSETDESSDDDDDIVRRQFLAYFFSGDSD